MEARKIIKVASLAYDGCLASRQYEDEVRLKRVKKADTEGFNEYLIGLNAGFLSALSDDVINSNAPTAVLLNGASSRQCWTADASNNETGTFILAQDALLKKLNTLSIEKRYPRCWIKDTYLTADSHAGRTSGETYRIVTESKHDDASSILDTSSLGMLYAQLHKVAFDYQDAEVVFDFYNGNEAKSTVLHSFFEANRDLIPRNVILNFHVYTGTGIFDETKLKPIIKHLNPLEGEGEIERDFQQGYLNLIAKSEVDTSKPCDLLAGFINSGDVNKLQAFKASRKLLGGHMQMKVNGEDHELEVIHDELKALLAAINTAKTKVPNSEEGRDFAKSLEQFYLKLEIELTKTKKSVKKPENMQRTVNASPAMAAAKRFMRFVQEFNHTAELPNESEEEKLEKLRRHLENLATFQKDFTKSYGLRIFVDIAKSTGISFGCLLLAGAIGAGIGFGVGFLVGGPVGAVAVGVLGAMIAGALVAAIGGAVGTGLSVRLFEKDVKRREREQAERACLASGRPEALVGLRAG